MELDEFDPNWNFAGRVDVTNSFKWISGTLSFPADLVVASLQNSSVISDLEILNRTPTSILISGRYLLPTGAYRLPLENVQGFANTPFQNFYRNIVNNGEKFFVRVRVRGNEGQIDVGVEQRGSLIAKNASDYLSTVETTARKISKRVQRAFNKLLVNLAMFPGTTESAALRRIQDMPTSEGPGKIIRSFMGGK